MKTPEVLIQKYSHRQLYDSDASHYVKLQHIARMVRNGSDVSVVDGRTGKDGTLIILTQIITETGKESQIALPLQLLTARSISITRLRTPLTPGSRRRRTPSRPRSITCATCWQTHSWPPTTQGGEVEQLRRCVKEMQSRLAHRDVYQNCLHSGLGFTMGGSKWRKM
jgi:polyhydroxyalkanoate synthesis repressor PhaR